MNMVLRCHWFLLFMWPPIWLVTLQMKIVLKKTSWKYLYSFKIPSHTAPETGYAGMIQRPDPIIRFTIAGTNWSTWGSDLSLLRHRALHNLSTLPVEINPSKQPILARDVDLKCMCNYTVFKRRDNKILSRQRFISGSASIAAVLPPESDGNLGKVVNPVLTPSRMDRMHPVFQVHLFWWHAVSY